ncbi:hypothetical protein DY000_02052649 [Brassica cretica]|uniref:Uncharacterized protein n=1 Tax=Brassica cretica TaxID=69181 RepID=A0ABQ7ADG1_BRACR|nr:hypothetical protein DY000_02052649 [Brassica cretica]
MHGFVSYRRFGRARSLRSDRATFFGLFSDDSRFFCRALHARILAKRQILGSRIKVFDTMPRDVRDQCAGFRARPRFTPGFRGCDD